MGDSQRISPIMKRIYYILIPVALTFFPMTYTLGEGIGSLYTATGSNDEPHQDTVGIENPADHFPAVLIIGDDPDTFESLSGIYKTNLLTACRNNMDLAFSNWMEMMMKIEAYAEKTEFDINGTKMWIKFFWGSDGTIEHIAYHLKPNSRNADLRNLTEFFERFMKAYKFPISFDANYSHYASASFPTFYKRALSE